MRSGAKQKADNVSGLLGEYSLKIFMRAAVQSCHRDFLLRIGIDDFKNINESHGNGIRRLYFKKNGTVY